MKAKQLAIIAAIQIVITVGFSFAQTSIGNVFRLVNLNETSFPAASTLYTGGLMYGTDAGVPFMSNGVSWLPLGITLSGTTAQIPSGSVTAGRTFFDLDAGIPLWWNSAAWVDAAGADPTASGRQFMTTASQTFDGFKVYNMGIDVSAGGTGSPINGLNATGGSSSAGGSGIVAQGVNGSSPIQPGYGVVAYGGDSYDSYGLLAVAGTGGGGLYAQGDTAGVGGTFLGGTDGAPINLVPRTGAPSTPNEGDVWLDSSDDTFHIYLGGADRVVTTTP